MAAKKRGKRRGRPPKIRTLEDLEREDGLSESELEGLAMEEDSIAVADNEPNTELVMREIPSGKRLAVHLHALHEDVVGTLISHPDV